MHRDLSFLYLIIYIRTSKLKLNLQSRNPPIFLLIEARNWNVYVAYSLIFIKNKHILQEKRVK